MSDRIICAPNPLCAPGFTTLNSVWLLSAAASYKIQPNVELFGRVENALDHRYQEIYGYNTPGIAAFAGVKITLGAPAAK